MCPGRINARAIRRRRLFSHGSVLELAEREFIDAARAASDDRPFSVTTYVAFDPGLLDADHPQRVEMRARGFSLASITLEPWLAVAFLGVGCSFLATFLYVTALGMTESQKVGVYLYIIPPMTAVAASLILSEPITLGLVFGAVLVIAGVALTERG